MRSLRSTIGDSLLSPSSRTTSRSTPSCLPAAATVMAMRTAAASRVTLVHGWSGIAISRETGFFAFMRA
ncbi:MAG: hypothetical protein B7X99_06515, partial [Rhizobiales bacterium 17-65-6]